MLYSIKGVEMKRYGFGKFLVDITLVFLTGGLWLIWIFVREMRRRSVTA